MAPCNTMRNPPSWIVTTDEFGLYSYPLQMQLHCWYTVTVHMIFKFGKIEIWRTFLVGVPIHPAFPIHPDLRYWLFSTTAQCIALHLKFTSLQCHNAVVSAGTEIQTLQLTIKWIQCSMNKDLDQEKVDSGMQVIQV